MHQAVRIKYAITKRPHRLRQGLSAVQACRLERPTNMLQTWRSVTSCSHVNFFYCSNVMRIRRFVRIETILASVPKLDGFLKKHQNYSVCNDSTTTSSFTMVHKSAITQNYHYAQTDACLSMSDFWRCDKHRCDPCPGIFRLVSHGNHASHFWRVKSVRNDVLNYQLQHSLAIVFRLERCMKRPK